MVLVACQTDLPIEQWEVSSEEGTELAREIGCPFLETSAKTGHHVDEPFYTLLRQIKPETAKPRRNHGCTII
jgi:GTPase KRas